MSTKRLLVIQSCAECTMCVHVEDSGREWDACSAIRPNRMVTNACGPIPSFCPLEVADPDHHEDPRGWVT